MKLKNLLNVAYVAVATIVGTCSLSAMDAEFAPMGAAQAKLRGSHYKTVALGHVAAPGHYAALAHSDTDLVLKGITDGNNDAYIAAAKVRMAADAGGWIDTLVAGGAAFILAGVQQDGLDAGGTGIAPADATMEQFKAALVLVIDAAAPAYRATVATSGSIKDLSTVKENVDIQIKAHVDLWIDAIIGAAPMLADAVLRAAADGTAGAGSVIPGVPTTSGRDDFKAALDTIFLK